jgi:hypothetical protein
MPRINYRIPNFSLLVGTFDATNYLDTISLSAPQSEPDSPLFWSGDFQISFNRKAIALGLTPADLDPLTSPLRWRPGLAKVELTIDGHLFPALRIDRYVYDPQTRQGKGTLVQILELLSGDRPATEPDVAAGMATPLAEVVDKLLIAAYDGTTLAIPPRLLTGITGTLDSPLSTRDPIADAQKLCSVNWQWLAVDSNESIITVSGRPSDRPLLFSRSLDQVEWEPDLDAIHFAAEQVIVTGSRQIVDDSIDCSDQPADPNVDQLGRPKRVATQTYQPFGVLFPQRPKDATPTLAEEKIILYAYNYAANYGTVFAAGIYFQLLQGGDTQSMESDLRSANFDNTTDIDANTPIQTMTIKNQPRGVLFPDLGLATSLITAEVAIETPFLRSTYKPRGLVLPDPKLPKTSSRRFELILERRERLSDERASRRPSHGGGLNPRTGRVQCLEQSPDPEPQQFAPDVRLRTEAIKGECRIAPNGWTPLIKRPLIQDFGFIPSQAHADNLANQIAFREISRRDTVQITMPIPIEWMQVGFPHLARCRIHDAEFLIDGPIITIADGAAKFSFAGSRLGTVTPPVPATPLPPTYIPNGNLQLLLPASIAAQANVPIQPIQLVAGGGSNIVFSSANLPPGLSLSPAGVLSGSVANNASVSIVATDVASNAVLANLTINVLSTTLTPPAREQINIQSVCRSKLTEVTPPQTILLSSRSVFEAVPPVVAPPGIAPTELISRPSLLVYPNPGYSSAIATLHGSDGLQQIMSSEDDNFELLPDLGFDFNVYGVNRRNALYVGSNSYITFGYGSSSTSASATSPGAGLFISTGDRSIDKIWAGPDGFNRYRVRWEGRQYYDSGNPIDRYWEVIFFADNTMMLVTGAFAIDVNDSDSVGYSAITNGSTAVPMSLSDNNSWVLVPGSTNYTINNGSYS